MTTNSNSIGQKVAKLIINGDNFSENTNIAISVSRSILLGDWAKLDSLLDKDFTYTGDGFIFTKDQYIGFMQEMRAAFSDFEMILEKIIAQDDFVSIRFTSNVINTGKFMGAPANSKNLIVTGIFMRKIANGKVKQEWQTTDLLGTMNQIGFSALLGYTVFIGGFKVKQDAPVRKPDHFLNINGKVENYDKLTSAEKNKYVKKFLAEMKKN